jgi:hypothetical protein
MSGTDGNSAKSQFKPGNRGRPAGSKNRKSRLLEALVDANAGDVFDACLRQALAGDVQAQRAILSLAHVRKDRPISVQLPIVSSGADAAAAALAIVQQTTAGRLAPSEAEALLGLLKSYQTVVANGELEERLATLEKLALKSAAAGQSITWDTL